MKTPPRTHVSIAPEAPKSGIEFKTACGVTIDRLDMPFLLEGDARTGDLMQLGNCWKCRRKLKVPKSGRYAIFGAAEKAEVEELAVEAGEFKDLE
jgi:hypothetical protein